MKAGVGWSVRLRHALLCSPHFQSERSGWQAPLLGSSLCCVASSWIVGKQKGFWWLLIFDLLFSGFIWDQGCLDKSNIAWRAESAIRQ